MLYSWGSIQTEMTSSSDFFSIINSYTVHTDCLRDCIVIDIKFVDNYEERTVISNEDILLPPMNSHDQIQEFICHHSRRYRQMVGEEENPRPRRINRENIMNPYSSSVAPLYSERDFERVREIMRERELRFPPSMPLRTIPLFDEVLGVRRPNTPRPDYEAINKTREKCFDAKTGLIFYNARESSNLLSLREDYQGCLECAWYSFVFYNKNDTLQFPIIESDEDFERVKNNFVAHFNESHKDIIAKKLSLKNPQRYT